MERGLIDWIVFWAIVAILFYIDLYLSEHRKGRISLKTSLIWSAVWIGAALLFNAFIYYDLGKDKAIEFLTGYLVEKSLSVDNLFVFLLIFQVMNVKPEQQPHVLKWGILGAIVFRIIFILAGVGLINLFEPIIFVFAAILLYAAYKMAFGGEHKIDVKNNWLVKLASRYLNFDPDYTGGKFFITKGHKRYATPMFITLLLIESSDIVFAVDSILGLRALYFALAGVVDLFVYLKYGVAIILFYVGMKMIISEWYHIPTEYSLVFILVMLTGSVVLSLLKRPKRNQK